MKTRKQGNQHIKKPIVADRLFDVDLAGRAPASLGTNTSMLLYTPQAQAHRNIIKTKEALLQGLLLWYRVLTRDASQLVLWVQYSKSTEYVNGFNVDS